MQAIKKITNVFEHVSDATRILREIKLLRLLKHPDIVEIKHIMLPPSPRDYKDIYVVFELLETDLHQVFSGPQACKQQLSKACPVARGLMHPGSMRSQGSTCCAARVVGENAAACRQQVAETVVICRIWGGSTVSRGTSLT
jgi:serine/threonine protein kinase